MPIKLVKSNPATDDKKMLMTVIYRAELYNKVLKKYVPGSANMIAVPEKNVKKLKGKYRTIREYINSDKKWIKLRDYDDSEIDYEDWITTLIRNWDKILIIMNIAKLPVTPVFNVVMSEKMKKIFLFLYEQTEKEREMNKKKVMKEDSKSLLPTIEPEIDNLIYYVDTREGMSIDDILITFRRDFSETFVALIDRMRKKGLTDDQIMEKFRKT